jgi:hypothetical protein
MHADVMNRVSRFGPPMQQHVVRIACVMHCKETLMHKFKYLEVTSTLQYVKITSDVAL